MSLQGHRVAAYYQTQYDWGRNASYVSPLPLIGLVTHIYLAAIHINQGKPLGQSIHLNDNPPEASPYYDRMWDELEVVKASGIKIVGMLGGAAPGTYPSLTPEHWDRYYPDLHKLIYDYKLDGIDIDVEEYTSIDVVTRLITQLKGDFGKDFIITLAPVASALTGGSNLSGFNYVQLEQTVGANISWYNAQFYSGFGSIFPEDQYVRITNYANGLFPPNKVVASVLTNPSLGYGYVAPARVVESLQDLVALYGPSFGGVCGWEYFASLPGYPGAPWQWAQTMKGALATLQKNYTNPSTETRNAALKRIQDRTARRIQEAGRAGVDLTKDVPITGPMRKESRKPAEAED